MLAVLRRRWLVVVAFLAVSLAAGGSYLLVASKQYTSTASLYVQPVAPRTIGSATDSAAAVAAAASGNSNFLNTQREIIASNAIAAMVLSDAEIASLKTLEAAADAGPGGPLLWLRKELRVEVGKKDDIIRVELDSPYREEAAQIVNAVVDAYVKFQTGQKHSTATKLRDMLEKERANNESLMADLDRNMREFQAQSGVVSFDQGTLDSRSQSLAKYREAVTGAALHTTEAKAGLDEAVMAWDPAVPLPPENAVAKGGAVVASEADLARLRASIFDEQQKLDVLKRKYLDNHPWVKTQAELVQNLKAGYLTAARLSYHKAEQYERQMRAALGDEERFAADFGQRAAQYRKLEGEKKQLEEGTSVLANRIREVRLDEEAGALNISVLQAATPGLKPSRPQKLHVLLASLCVGLLGGLGLAWVRHRTDPRFSGPHELEQAVGLPVLGSVPGTSKTAGNLNPLNPLPLDRWSNAAEASRQIASSLNALEPKGSAPAVLITSPRPAEGRSTVARDLAIALATAGQHVLLIDADFQNPSLHELVATRNAQGLATVVTGDVPLDRAVTPSAIANLDVLTSGPAPSMPAALFDSPEFEAFLGAAAGKYDRVLIDASAVHAANDARIAAQAAGATLLVVAASNLNKRAVREARDRLVGFGAHIVGIVVNEVPGGAHRRAGRGKRGRQQRTSVSLKTASRIAEADLGVAGSSPAPRNRQIPASTR
jgi:capsular exopolysaccharide synthesis family protein